MKNVSVSESFVNGCRVVCARPESPRGVLAWFHGGGWAVPLGEDSISWGRDLAAATGLEVRMPDYPLAKKAPFPEINAWCRDYWKNLCETCTNAGTPVFMGGDSAGAHLALLSLSAGTPEKAAFIYAVTTLLPERERGSWAAYEKSWTLSPRLMDFFCKGYCPDLAARRELSPLEILEKIPPTLLITAEDDILADQQTAFAQKFGARQIVYRGAKHIFLSREDGAEFRSRALCDLAAFFACE